MSDVKNYFIDFLHLAVVTLYFIVDSENVFHLWALMGAHSLLYIYCFINFNKLNITIKRILFYLFISSFVVFSDAIFEDDYFRYMWDGRVFANGINPYKYLPREIELNFLNVSYRSLVGWSQYPTIYPPVAQYFFAFIHLLVPDSLIALKLFFFSCFIGSALILGLALKEHKEQLKVLYLWCSSPLIWKEILNSAHLDVLATVLILASLFFLHKKKSILSYFFLALSVLVKYYSLAFLPFYFLFFKKKRMRNLTVFWGTIIVLYLPFIWEQVDLLFSFKVFSNVWFWNSAFFQLLSYIFSDYLARYISWGVIFSFYFYQLYLFSKIRTADVLLKSIVNVLLCLLLLSPTFQPHYFVWVLPLALLNMDYKIVYMSLLVVLGYAGFHSGHQQTLFNYVFIGLEYFLFTGLIIWRLKGQEKGLNYVK